MKRWLLVMLCVMNSIHGMDLEELDSSSIHGVDLEALDSSSDESDAFLVAVTAGNAQEVWRMIWQEEKKPDVRYKGIPVLVIAAEEGHRDVVKVLLDARALPNATMKDSNVTALHVAARRKDLKTGKLLMDHGADVNAEDISKETPLHNAARVGALDFVKELLIQGAQKSAENSAKQTAAQVAKEYNRHKIYNLLK